MNQNRRKFISTVLIAGASLPFASGLGYQIPPASERKFPVRLFSKPLDSYDFDFMCECLVKSGIGGFDLTVRPGGKVEPARVETDLPELIQKAGKYNTAVDMIVTGIISAADTSTEIILKTASASEIKNYRLGWFEYDFKTGVQESLVRYKKSLKEINELNKKYRISGSYQNHSGLYVGASVWDLYEMLRDISPEYTGSQYDVRHAVVEGANSWITGMRLIVPYIKTLAIKDFEWQKVNGRTEAVSEPLL
jgi:L-ribulose-5-phosphate 3-epimerase